MGGKRGYENWGVPQFFYWSGCSLIAWVKRIHPSCYKSAAGVFKQHMVFNKRKLCIFLSFKTLGLSMLVWRALWYFQTLHESLHQSILKLQKNISPQMPTVVFESRISGRKIQSIMYCTVGKQKHKKAGSNGLLMFVIFCSCWEETSRNNTFKIRETAVAGDCRQTFLAQGIPNNIFCNVF